MASENLYIIWQEGNFAECESYNSEVDANDAAKDLLLKTVAEHTFANVYVCKAIVKYSPNQSITVTGEKLD